MGLVDDARATVEYHRAVGDTLGYRGAIAEIAKKYTNLEKAFQELQTKKEHNKWEQIFIQHYKITSTMILE